MGLAMFGLVIPRLATRMFSHIPPHVPAPQIQVLAGKLSHVALYGFLVFMPLSGN